MYHDIPSISAKDEMEMRLTSAVIDPNFSTDTFEGAQTFLENLIGYYVSRQVEVELHLGHRRGEIGRAALAEHRQQERHEHGDEAECDALSAGHPGTVTRPSPSQRTWAR